MSMPLIFDNVFGEVTPSLTAELTTYWSSSDLAVAGNMSERAKQVALLARSAEGEIVGVASVEMTIILHKKCNFIL